MPERTLTIQQAMKVASVSRRTIYNWLGLNKIRYARTAGGSVRIFADSLFQPGNVGAHVRGVDEIQSQEAGRL